MLTKDITILNESGLHARPSTTLVNAAGKFQADVQLIKEGKSYNAKSIMGIMSMGGQKGDVITIQVDGSDEEQALDTLVGLFLSKFSE